ncbi:hypothetical protein AB3S75_024509 [Citrus x aurantiifolia]
MANMDPYAKQKMLKTEENRANPTPEFINQSLFTRSWELLHLVFVGIAVSYGLFSHRNDETEKETNNHTKFDNAQTYVSRFLQVSSVFDDENENSSSSDENKVQTWSNQYYRNEPVVVVAKEHSALDQEQMVNCSSFGGGGEKPLLLPVRSLKSRVSDTDTVEPIKEFKSLSRSSSNSGSRRFSSNSNKRKNRELGGFDQVKLEEKLNENVVLPSPIPWRTRSGRMEMKEDVDSPVPPLNPLPPSVEEADLNGLESRSLRSQMPRSNRPNTTSSSPKLSSSPSLSSPKKLSPSPSLSSESQAKNSEDLVRKKSFYRPPPPPPPPPPMMHRSSTMKVSSGLDNDGASFEKKNLNRSFTTETKQSVRTMRSTDRETDQTSFKTEQLRRESVNFMPNASFMQFPEQDKEEFVDKVVVETDEDSGTEYDEEDVTGETPFISNIDRSSNNEAAAASISSSVSDGGPDVDKKADEFIAKFREQIRLQRIESIKRSSAQISRNSSR